MGKHFHFDLKDIPQGIWMLILSASIFFIGRIYNVPLLETIGIWAIAAVGIVVLLFAAGTILFPLFN